MSAYVSGFTRLRTALSIELPPVILFSESNVALLFKEMFALILSQRTESLFTSLPKPSIIFFDSRIPDKIIVQSSPVKHSERRQAYTHLPPAYLYI